MRDRTEQTQTSPARRSTNSFLQQINSLLLKVNGFRDSQGNLIPELLDTEAKKLGEAFGPQGVQLSSSQLRRFYNDVKDLQHRIESDLRKEEKGMESDEPEDLKKYLALVKMLKAKAAYGTRKRNLIPPQFKETIDKCIEFIKSPRDFRDFTLFFECIVGYYYGAGGEKIR